jgi:hypothetical protein
VFRHLKILRTVAAIIALLATGCLSNNDISSFRGQDTGSSGPTAVQDTVSGDTADGATELKPEPYWFSLGASLTLEDGVPLAVTLSLAFYGEDLGELDCTESRDVSGIVVSRDTPDPSVFHWWRLNSVAVASACVNPGQLPQDLVLGLGALHPEVEAQLLSVGLDGVAGSLYGAYALLDPDQLDLDPEDQVALAYGYGGTASDRAGESDALETGPLVDGDYELTGIYLFPLKGFD